MVDTYGPVVDFGRGKYHYIYLLSVEANEHIRLFGFERGVRVRVG
jgi:hypothetical protein